MEPKATNKRCKTCHKKIYTTTNRGPIPDYCSPAHRQKAYRERQKTRMQETTENHKPTIASSIHEMSSQLMAFAEATAGYKQHCENIGISKHAAEVMSLDFHAALMRQVGK